LELSRKRLETGAFFMPIFRRWRYWGIICRVMPVSQCL